MSANNDSFGLVAVGTSGGWSVEIDQSNDDSMVWYLQIESRMIDIRFPICGPQACEQLRDFTSAKSGSPPTDELSLGGTVTVLRDDEYADRFFLLVGYDDVALVRICIAGEELKCFREALDQVHSDLVSDGVLS